MSLLRSRRAKTPPRTTSNSPKMRGMFDDMVYIAGNVIINLAKVW